jgi:hypothetical protein
VLDAPPYNINVLLWRDTCVSIILLNRHIRKKWGFIPQENSDGGAVSFQKLAQFSWGKNILDAQPSNLHAFFWEIYHVFQQCAKKSYSRQNVRFYPLKTLKGRQYSFQKLIQFSLVNKVLNAPACILDGFLLRDTCISSTELNRPMWNKMCVSTSWKL